MNANCQIVHKYNLSFSLYGYRTFLSGHDLKIFRWKFPQKMKFL